MKESKKRIKDALKKTTDKGDKFEKLVMDLALKKMSGAQKDSFGVYYSKKQKRLLMPQRHWKELTRLPKVRRKSRIMPSGAVLLSIILIFRKR